MNPVLTQLVSLTVAALFGAVTGYLGGLLKKARADRERVERERAEDKETMRYTALTVYRLAIYDEHFDIDEKVETYRRYRALGGNHKTKKYMDELLGEDADAYLAKHE